MKQPLVALAVAGVISLSAPSITIAAPFKVGDTIQVKTQKGTRFGIRIIRADEMIGLWQP